MAKKKKQTIEADVASNEINEEVIEEIVTEIVTDEVSDEVAPVEIEEAVIEEVAEEDKSDQFYFTQLKVINKLNNPAKQRRLAERVLRNRKQRGK